MARQAGWLVERLLHRWRLDHLDVPVASLVEELALNAVRHNAGPITVRLLYADALLCEVSDTTGHLPVVLEGGGTDVPGKGLPRLSGCTRRWGAYRTATGKVVWFDYPLTVRFRPAGHPRNRG